MTEPQKEFDCIYYPMCHWAYELLYCPKKARGDECEDYKPAKESSDVLDELRVLKEYDIIKFYPGGGCLPNTRQTAKISRLSKDGKRVGVEYQQSCNIGVQMSIPISDVRSVCRWIELRQQQEKP